MRQSALIVNRNAAIGNIRRPISPRFLAPNGDDGPGLGANTWAQSAMAFQAPEPINGFQCDAVGWQIQINNNPEANLGAARTVRGAIEYPVGSGILFPFTWAGSATKSITAGSLQNLSDVLYIPGGIPQGGIYRIWWEEVGTAFLMITSARKLPTTAPSNQIGSFALYSLEQYQSGTSGMPTLGTALSGTTSGTAMVAPNMVTALHKSSRPIVGFLGDSNMVEQAHTPDRFGVCGFPQAISPYADVIKFAMSGNAIQHQCSPFSRRLAFWQNYGVKHAVILLGTNDVNSSRTAAQIRANRDTLAATLMGGGIIPHYCTIPPVNQPATNDTERVQSNIDLRADSGSGNYGTHIELGNFCTTTDDGPTWKTGHSVADTGLHLNWPQTTPFTVPNALRALMRAFVSTLT